MEEAAGEIARFGLNDISGLPPGVGLLIILLCVAVACLAWWIVLRERKINDHEQYQRDLIDQMLEREAATAKQDASLINAFEGMKTEFIRLQQRGG